LNYAPENCTFIRLAAPFYPNSLRQDSTYVQKIKRKYYNFLITAAQAKSYYYQKHRENM